MPETRLIYFSENLIDASDGTLLPTLSAILSTSNRNNRPLGLTGALVFDEQWFLQVIEGDRLAVWRTFERIREDERHSNLVVAEMVEIGERTFANWWMGGAVRNAKTEDVFTAFHKQGCFEPRKMSASEMLSMVVSLAALGLHRELVPTRAA